MITFDVKGVERLRETLDGTTKSLNKELAIVINKVAKKTKSGIAKQVGKKITLAQKRIKRLISIPVAAKDGSLSATVRLKGTKRINLKFFKAKQTKTGVTTKVYKDSAPQIDRSAFMVRRWGNRIIRRVGKTRGPLKSLTGPSVVEVFEGVQTDLTSEMQTELTKQMNERIRYLTLKKTGAI